MNLVSHKTAMSDMSICWDEPKCAYLISIRSSRPEPQELLVNKDEFDHLLDMLYEVRDIEDRGIAAVMGEDE